MGNVALNNSCSGVDAVRIWNQLRKYPRTKKKERKRAETEGLGRWKRRKRGGRGEERKEKERKKGKGISWMNWTQEEKHSALESFMDLRES